MEINIVSPTRIEIDGNDAGHPLDVFESHVDLRPAIRQAFIDWHVSHMLWEQKVQRNADDRVEEVFKQCADRVAELENDMAVLGTKEEAQKMRVEARRKALQAELALLDDSSAT